MLAREQHQRSAELSVTRSPALDDVVVVVRCWKLLLSQQALPYEQARLLVAHRRH